MKYKSIYVAASGQHVGKTTTTLGLIANFLKKGLNVGYCKPVGQKFLDIEKLRVDKDTLLFADLINFNMIPEIHSPIILGKGATETIIDNPELKDQIIQELKDAKKELEKNHELVVYEGTGHTGVGSIAGVSNAKVAKLVDAHVIMVIPGGIGSTIDKLNMCLSLFREENVPVLGVIVNKVLPDKIPKIKHYLGKWFESNELELLGIIPYDKHLAHPIMKTVCIAINGTVLSHAENLNNEVEDIIAGSLVRYEELKDSKNLLLVVGAENLHNAIRKIKLLTQDIEGEHESPLAGIVATGKEEINEEAFEYVDKYKIPLVKTMLDTYGSVLKISRIEVKINRNTPWKVKRAIELIEENVDLDNLLKN
ncbi:AAA family ATPase [Portibacter marinus]|uniref:AAA family ATPase n=1 Tax=Portibacter marinus TaxID=2898660 RepID=UPI001F38B04A|nr:AAA family ATPase [Portibacter marinus]